MDVGCVEHLALSCGEPRGLRRTVTFGTAPMAAGVIGLLFVPTMIALGDMAAEGGAGGAAQGGPALRSGLRRGGRCGRKLSVAYSGTPGRVPRASCHAGRVARGSSSWLPGGGRRVDRAGETTVLDAIQPAGITAAVEALERMHSETGSHPPGVDPGGRASTLRGPTGAPALGLRGSGPPPARRRPRTALERDPCPGCRGGSPAGGVRGPAAHAQ
jgi:hypothetical protein